MRMNGTQIERIKRIYRIIILPQRRQRKLRSSGRVEKWKSETRARHRSTPSPSFQSSGDPQNRMDCLESPEQSRG